MHHLLNSICQHEDVYEPYICFKTEGVTTSDTPLASRSCTALRLQYWHSYALAAKRAHLRKHTVINLDTVAYHTALKTREHYKPHNSRALELKAVALAVES
jgi:hypothetical protein